jgi:hypothetical protein
VANRQEGEEGEEQLDRKPDRNMRKHEKEGGRNGEKKAEKETRQGIKKRKLGFFWWYHDHGLLLCDTM